MANYLPPVVPRSVVEALLGERLQLGKYKIESQGRDLTVERFERTVNTLAYWKITPADGKWIMVLEKGYEGEG